MHELSIATALMEQILDIAKTNGMDVVDQVELETGFLRQVIPEVMQLAYKEVIVDTIAKSSILIIIEVEAKAQCRRCMKVFEPEMGNFLCPDCLVADVDIKSGNEIILKSIGGIPVL
ncbi:hypothetical protein MNBD_UNCLBAC01-1716 [hydrothermal vent metagenome]|uniref:[NiFe] hydrogenase nickel incorporation protein HypA n=1 Tax=hydrothermal vent metagenome TaxID=652676 RepID=A0A3B1DGX2_9ZZZZ